MGANSFVPLTMVYALVLFTLTPTLSLRERGYKDVAGV